jgi:DNA mismatch repair ATPase MutS
MWFERPTKDMDVLTERHDAIAFLYHDCNLEITTFLRNLVKDVTSVKARYSTVL